MQPAVGASPPIPPPRHSALVLSVVAATVVVLVLVSSSDAVHSTDPLRNPVLCGAVRSWRTQYGPGDDLQVVLTQVTFHGAARNFVPGEGVIVAPVGMSLGGAQELLQVTG